MRKLGAHTVVVVNVVVVQVAVVVDVEAVGMGATKQRAKPSALK